jgi:hypothetical protein
MGKKKVTRSNRAHKKLPERGQRIALFGTRIPFLARFSVSEWAGFAIVLAFCILLLVVAIAL